MNNIKKQISFIILLLLMHYRVNLIGSMSLTEIYIVTQIPRLLNWVNTKGRKIPNLTKAVNAFYLLIIAQYISEFMIHNSLTNALKGIAVTVMTLFIMLFFLEKILKDISLLRWIPITTAMSILIFGDQFGFADNDESAYFKFYLAPIIIYSVCFITMIQWKWFQKNIIILLLCTSIFIIIGGARSLGFSLLFTSIFYVIYTKYKTIKLRTIIPGIIATLILVQSFLTFVYIPKVKAGEWGSDQNRSQFEMIDWNSNILMLLFAARTDFFVSGIAFLDKPLWGHGSWAMDTSNKYYLLQAHLLGEEIHNTEKLRMVPNHSVVMGKGTANGVFAFFIFLWIFITIYKIGLRGLRNGSPYNIFLIWTIISSFQLLMFGPPAVLKNNGAIAFAIMFSLYYINQLKIYEQKNRIVRSNGNIQT